MVPRTSRFVIGVVVLLVATSGAVSPGPVTAAAPPTVTAVSAGGDHTCAVMADGTVRCWGYNAYGQLGDGSTDRRLTPVSVAGISTATSITVGEYHSCALLTGGSIRCWGGNATGALGDGTTADSLTPVAVSGISTATAVAAGDRHTCAVLADHTVRCWGWNTEGQLGDGTTTARLTPVEVAGISTATVVVGGEIGFTCALLAGGSIRCWGNNTSGQLGDGTRTTRLAPVAVSGISTATAVDAGDAHTCAVLTDGSVRCWGSNWAGELGDGTMSPPRAVPVAVVGISTATAVAAGGQHSCAAMTDGTSRCWGHNGSGQLGDGTLTSSWNPVAVTGMSTATAITAGSGHTCALLVDGAPWCWGAGGALGTGTTTGSLVPVPVSWTAPAAPFTDIEGSPFRSEITWAWQYGITGGCSPTLYCPDAFVTREEMASFLARALLLWRSAPTPDAFTDDETSIHELNINLVAREGITVGCAPGRFCPTGLVSREQMASFLARALKLSGPAPDAFTDDETSIHELNIDLVAREAVATGCGDNKYCPTANVTRGQMAAFLHRAFGP
jgi:alpha-tubulin suppressor-like RCC1 family protein